MAINIKNLKVMEKSTVLIVDDDPFIRDSLREVLEYERFDCIEAVDGKSALDLISEKEIDAILLDLRLPRVDGMEVLQKSIKTNPNIPVIIISGEGTIKQAYQAAKIGAFDFIEKPLEAERVLITLRNALNIKTIKAERDLAVEETQSKYKMVGNDSAFQRVYDFIDQAAQVNTKVLITGESGTGKELVARAIHFRSSRSAAPFIAVNCSALPDTLIESELFGHKKGAFTGANTEYMGKIYAANNGTLLLDEIGDMALGTQAKILRVLESDTIEPLGSEKSIPVNVRIIASTNKDLHEKVKSGEFREDLFYRLNVFPLRLPPLRARKNDIKILGEYFLEIFALEQKKKVPKFSQAAWNVLLEYKWPGNVRELKNIVERLVIISQTETIEIGTVYQVMNMGKPKGINIIEAKTLQAARAEFETKFITNTLLANDNKIIETASVLGIQRSQLWRKMKQYGINVQ